MVEALPVSPARSEQHLHITDGMPVIINTIDGKGRWLYRDDAPYILMTCAEIKFCLAETYWKLGMNAEAYEAFKAGVTAIWISHPTIFIREPKDRQ